MIILCATVDAKQWTSLSTTTKNNNEQIIMYVLGLEDFMR